MLLITRGGVTPQTRDRMRGWKIYIALVLTAASAAAETGGSPAFGFLTIEPGARPGGVGKAFTAVADDAYAGYYNPGGFGLQTRTTLTFMHERRAAADVKDFFFDYVAGGWSIGKGGRLGASIAYHNSGRVETTDPQGAPLGTLHLYHVAPSVYWGYPLFARLGIGVGLTYAYEHLSDRAGGVNRDLLASAGALYRTPLPGFQIGLAFSGLGPNIQADARGSGVTNAYNSRPPRTARLGLAYYAVSNDLNDLLVTADGAKLLINLNDHLDDELGQAVYSWGAEYVYAKMIAVRAGYYLEKTGVVEGLTLGIGVTYRGFTFDYARIPEGELFQNQNRFSFGYGF